MDEGDVYRAYWQSWKLEEIFNLLFMILQLESGQSVFDKYLHNCNECLNLLKNVNPFFSVHFSDYKASSRFRFSQ